MATNLASTFASDLEAVIADETLPLAQRQLVVYSFGDKMRIPEGRGTTLTMTRFNRLPLPFAPLSEGVPPVGSSMSISQVTVQVQQWGGLVLLSDVAELTIKHPVVEEAKKIIALQSAETNERNTFVALNSGTQINYVNSKGSRGSLATTDVLNTFELSRAKTILKTIGAPFFMGTEQTDEEIDATRNADELSRKMPSPHYIAVCHPNVASDLMQNATFVQASTYSDANKLYGGQFGQWAGISFVESNMVPSWTGKTTLGGTPQNSGGNLATGAAYAVQVTASDIQNQYESIIYASTTGLSVTGPNGSIQVTLPSLPGFTFSVYISTSSTLSNLGVCSAGPTSGPFQGMATQLAPGQTVTITGIGTAQVPPATPASTVVVYPTYIFGRGAYASVVLDDIKVTYLGKAEKIDPLNQLRQVSWKIFNGVLLKNQLFMMRIEGSSAFSTTFG